MSNLDFNMVGLAPLAFPSSFSSSLPPFDVETMAPVETNMLGFYPKNVGSCPTPSVRDEVKELGELLAPGQSGKVQIPRVHSALSKHLPRLSERRVRSMFHGEIGHLWDYEKEALRTALVIAKNTKERNALHRAYVAIQRGLSAAGHPLSADQTRAINQMVGAPA